MVKDNRGDAASYVLPNFLIVGAAKAGSTSLYQWLKQHPDIFMPKWKEPGYFVDNHNYGIQDWGKYVSLFQPGNGKKGIGEASACYLANPITPQWIFEKLGDVKIIVVLRNPVDRAFSLYRYSLQWGSETITTFEEALREEESRLRNNNCPYYLWDYLYFKSGLYYEQVKRYLDTFSNVKVYLLEDLVESPKQTYSDICRFLEIDEGVMFDFKQFNISSVPRFIKAQFILRKYHMATRFRPGLFKKIVSYITLTLMNWNASMGVDLKMSSEMKNKLRTAYRPDIIKLSSLINRDLSKWL